jgi:hypothetical protein
VYQPCPEITDSGQAALKYSDCILGSELISRHGSLQKKKEQCKKSIVPIDVQKKRNSRRFSAKNQIGFLSAFVFHNEK